MALSEDEARRLVAERKRAGDADDEVVALLLQRGVTEEQARFVVATTLIAPDDPAEHLVGRETRCVVPRLLLNFKDPLLRRTRASSVTRRLATLSA
jgi:hypothetical protein